MRRYEVTIIRDGSQAHTWVQARSADHALGVAADQDPWARVIRARAA